MRKMFFLMPETSEAIAREKYTFVSEGLPRNLKICFGRVAERLKVLAWKASVEETLPRVRIPPLPPSLR